MQQFHQQSLHGFQVGFFHLFLNGFLQKLLFSCKKLNDHYQAQTMQDAVQSQLRFYLKYPFIFQERMEDY